MECVIVYSGGTDSTCVAALKAKEFKKIHLLTYYDQSTAHTPLPLDNVEKLRARFPGVQFVHKKICTDGIIKRLSYARYLRYFLRYRLLQVATCGYSSVSWHLRSIIYCLEHNISHVFDGLTKEMMQLPGHMDEVVALLGETYGRFGITYDNPVRDWETPPDQHFLDRLIVDQHGFIFADESNVEQRTTGKYLYDQKIFPHPNVKGSEFDRKMQHDCYPFVLYNIMIFWIYLNFFSYGKVCQRVRNLLSEKIEDLIPAVQKFKSEGKAALGDLYQSEENLEYGN